MKIDRVYISKCKLGDMRRTEADFFVRLAYMLNELNILQKCLVVASNGASTVDCVERRSQVCQALFFLRTLSGKLIAGWEMLQRDFFGGRLSKRFE